MLSAHYRSINLEILGTSDFTTHTELATLEKYISQMRSEMQRENCICSVNERMAKFPDGFIKI